MSTLRKLSSMVPEYPGRAALERGLRPVLTPLAKAYAGRRVLVMLGFWVAWHTMGGRQGLIDSGLTSKAAAYKHEHEFLEMFGARVEAWQPDAAVQLRRERGGGDG